MIVEFSNFVINIYMIGFNNRFDFMVRIVVGMC